MTSPSCPPRAVIADIPRSREAMRHGKASWLDQALEGCSLYTEKPGAIHEDHHLILLFLLEYEDSAQTFMAYRRDIERLALWCWWIKGIGIREVTREALQDFLRFFRSPPADWIGSEQQRRFDHNERPAAAWRPFWARNRKGMKTDRQAGAYRCSDAAMRACLASLSTFFGAMVRDHHMSTNPVTLLRQRRRITGTRQVRVVRRLTPVQWSACLDTARGLAQADPAQHERTLFVMVMLRGLFLRISELVPGLTHMPSMADFEREGEGWWFHVREGKGRKARRIAVGEDVLAALVRYRRHLGLPDTPVFGEETPLVPQLRGAGPVASSRQIRRIVQGCFTEAVARLEADGREDDAQGLRQATVHWLRHTGISEDVAYRDLSHVRDDAGHENISTTSLYIDADARARLSSKIRRS